MIRLQTVQITLFLIAFLPVSVNSQGKWSSTYLTGFNPFGESICQHYDNGYILAGRYGANYPTHNWIIKTDINGNVLWNKTIGNGNDFLVLTADVKSDLSGCIYLAGGAYFSNEEDNDPILMKLDSCGEKEWCAVFDVEGNNYINAQVICPDGSIVVLLRYMNPDVTQDRICLAKLSINGDLIWQQCYNSPNPRIYNQDAYDITLWPDGGYLISGGCDFQDSNPPHYLWLKPYYIKANSAGEFEWETVVNTETNRPGGWAWSTIMNPDSTFFYSSISHYITNSENAPALVKMDLSGNVVGVYDLAPGNHFGKLFESVFISDSTLAGSAVWGSENIGTPQAIIFDTLGNILDSSYLLDNGYLSYVRKTRDDKLLFFTNKYDESTEQFDAYLFKLNQQLESDTFYTYPFKYDTLCPYPIVSDTISQEGCDVIVGIGEEVMGSIGDEERMELFPNPANHFVNIRFSILDTRYSIFFYDIWGRKMSEITIPKGQKETKIDISAFPPGIYIAVLKTERKILDRKKFVVQRL